LVKAKSISTKTKVHTFGVGNGADERLIKGCALAGVGNFYFIYNDSEIERKVIDSLCKSRLEYLLVLEAKTYDEDDKEIHSLPNCPVPLSAGQVYEYSALL
jgi:hypothetical protein